MDEHPLAGLDEPGVRAVRQVVRGHALHAAGDGDVQGHLLGHRHALVRRHRRVLGVRLKHGGVGDAVAHLDALRLRLGRDRSHEAAAFLPADERELALVQTAAVVRVDEVDARVLVRHEHAAGRQLGDGVVVLHLHHGRRAGLAHHGGALRGKRNEQARNDGASAMAPEAVRRGYRAEAVASGRPKEKKRVDAFDVGGTAPRVEVARGSFTYHDLGHGGEAAGASEHLAGDAGSEDGGHGAFARSAIGGMTLEDQNPAQIGLVQCGPKNLHTKHQSLNSRNGDRAFSEITVSKTSQLFFWRKHRSFHQRMAPPAATAPPGVSNPHDARAVARIERVHELRKEALATGTSPLPDYDDVPVRSRRARIWKISKPLRLFVAPPADARDGDARRRTRR